MSESFVEVVILAVVSLLITFVLFRWLESHAEGQSDLMGGTIKYGGALAGFVLVFWLTSHAYQRTHDDEDRTEIDLAGEYRIEELSSNGQTSKGTATIRQRGRTTRVDITGDVESTQRPPSISFHTVEGVVRGRRLIWLYENEDREIGVALGDIQSDRPDRVVLIYSDLSGSDANSDPRGQLIFTRVEAK
jgi:hypothetical protein